MMVVAPPVSAHHRDQFGIAGELFEIELDHLATEPIANAAKSFERQRYGSHG
jgi:hypothetical protein